MHCRACDCLLSDFESTRKYEDNTYVDLCNHCFSESDLEGIVILEREDLQIIEFDEESEVGHDTAIQSS